jgi:hypothetical protein
MTDCITPNLTFVRMGDAVLSSPFAASSGTGSYVKFDKKHLTASMPGNKFFDRNFKTSCHRAM